MSDPNLNFTTAGGVRIERSTKAVDVEGAIEPLIDALDAHRGVVLTSTYEYPGRYTRWDLGFINPPLMLSARGRELRIDALNDRGEAMLPWVESAIAALADADVVQMSDDSGGLVVNVPASNQVFAEEERSRQPSVFSVLRGLNKFLRSSDDAHLGLYGAFGYDLVHQFEPIELHLQRDPRQRDLVLYLPDELIVVDRKRETAFRHRYEFSFEGISTAGRELTGAAVAFEPVANVDRSSDHAPGEYAAVVEDAKQYFRRGDLFEVVPGQTFSQSCPVAPSEVFRRLRKRNPSPYGAFMNLGDSEYIVAASPEMFVRVEGSRVETCPISGTIARGNDVLEDADQILALLKSTKDESELTMCTDVDRNDKSRICVPGSVKVIGRRQIEMYSRLIHTVDHVEGTLLPQFDALDAFLSHAWAVTVTGAPKLWAMRFIEEHERTPRAWYGGAIGALLFNGNLNTGLTLRTVRILDGVAQVRAGATLLIDSDPEAEELETRTKASAKLDAIERADVPDDDASVEGSGLGTGIRVLLVDHEDSFVHTLASYLRRTGADVTTVRVPVHGTFNPETLAEVRPDLVVISPGPGKPSDFHLSDTLRAALDRDLPVFGVCLGMQGMVEHFGGKLGILPHPAHGRSSPMSVTGGKLFEGLPETFTAGRYHSLYAEPASVPAELVVTAQSDDGVVMAVEHRDLPVAAVQFHPESMMSMRGEVGYRLIENVLQRLVLDRR